MVYEREVQWVPKTRLGKMVSAGEVRTIEEAFETGLPIKEAEIVDALIPDLVDEVLDISMVQRMTDSGRRVKFRTTVVVGNGNGYVGRVDLRPEVAHTFSLTGAWHDTARLRMQPRRISHH